MVSDQVRERHAATLARAYAKIDRETVQAQLGFADTAETVACTCHRSPGAIPWPRAHHMHIGLADCVARGWVHNGDILEPPSSLPSAASEVQLAGTPTHGT